MGRERVREREEGKEGGRKGDDSSLNPHVFEITSELLFKYSDCISGVALKKGVLAKNLLRHDQSETLTSLNLLTSITKEWTLHYNGLRIPKGVVSGCYIWNIFRGGK